MRMQTRLTRRSEPDRLLPAVALGLALMFTPCVPAPTQAQEHLLTFQKDQPTEIRVAQGKFVNARTSETISRVVVGDPNIATAVPLSGTILYFLGKDKGQTNVAVYGASDRLLGLVNVEVGADAPDLKQTLQEAVPQAKVRVETVNGRLRLSGSVPDGIAQRKVLEIAEQYSSIPVINALQVTGGQQVLLEVRVLEANRNAERDLGVSFVAQGTGPHASGVATGAAGQLRVGFPSGSTPFGAMLARVLGDGISADILVQALEQKGLGRRLAEPNLTALSGEKASFLAGGEVPIPVAEENNRVTVQYKEYGVRLNFTPTVLDNGLINLKLEPEVSQVDPSTTYRVGSIALPAFITRRASTTIDVRDGQSFAMAGLLQSTNTRSHEQLPWIGQIPILGTLFRSASFKKEETDLVIIVTPHLARPSKPGQPLRTPFDSAKPSNDIENFLLGRLETGTDMQRRYIEATGKTGPYGHIVELKPEPKHVAKKIVTRKKVIKP